VFVIFKYFLVTVARKRGGDLLNFCQTSQSPETGIFSDELRRTVLEKTDDPASMTAALPEYQFSELK
jgi:hypothetical protein